MAEVISQIWFGILLAGIIGGITGWFLRGNGKKRLQQLEESWQKRYQQLMQEKASCQEKIEHLHVIRHERNALSNKLKQMHDTAKNQTGLEARLSNLHQALEKKNQQYIEEQNNVSLLNKKIAKMQGLMREKNVMVHTITKKLANSGLLHKEKQESVERLEQETSDLQQRLANSEKKVMANDAHIQLLTSQIEQGQKNHPSENADGASPSAEELSQAQNEITELREQLESANVRIQEDQEKISRLVTELPVIAKQLHESQVEIQRRDDEVEALQTILGTKLDEYEKMDSNLDQHRISLLDANSKIEVLYDALDEEREKNQQINADNKLKDYRLTEYANDAENKALEIKALYGRLTSAEFDLVGAKNEGLSSLSANNLLTAHTDDVEQERKELLKKCDVIESELSHYKSELESREHQLEVQKVVNRKLKEELECIQAKELKSIDDTPLQDMPDDTTFDELKDEVHVVDSDTVESSEPISDSEQDDSINSEDVAKSIYDESKVQSETESFEVAAETDETESESESIQSTEEEADSDNKTSNLTASLLSGVAVAAGVSSAMEEGKTVDAEENPKVEANTPSPEQGIEEENQTDNVSAEDTGREKLATFGWYDNDAPKINLLAYNFDNSKAEGQPSRLSLARLDGMTDSKLTELKAYGVTSISDLYEFSKTPTEQRSTLQSKLQDDEWRVWCSQADLMRIDGMNMTECKMLNDLGIFSVEELSGVGESELKDEINLLKRKQKIAAAIGPNTVANWLKAAKDLMETVKKSV